MITKHTKIYIAGHRGMVGSAIWRLLEQKGYDNLIGRSSKELDLKKYRLKNLNKAVSRPNNLNITQTAIIKDAIPVKPTIGAKRCSSPLNESLISPPASIK